MKYVNYNKLIERQQSFIPERSLSLPPQNSIEHNTSFEM